VDWFAQRRSSPRMCSRDMPEVDRVSAKMDDRDAAGNLARGPHGRFDAPVPRGSGIAESEKIAVRR